MWDLWQVFKYNFVELYVYSGDSDGVLPLSGTRHSINAMRLKTSKRWYPWYHSHGLVGGWSQVYEGGLLTYSTVRAAGHEVPLSQPRLAFFLFSHFLANHSLPSSSSWLLLPPLTCLFLHLFQVFFFPSTLVNCFFFVSIHIIVHLERYIIGPHGCSWTFCLVFPYIVWMILFVSCAVIWT